MAARTDVRADVHTEVRSAADSDTGLATGRADERVVAPWPTVHAGTPPTAGPRLEVVRTFPLPAGEVWSAVTEPERLGRWFADVTGDLRVGGTWTATFPQGSASGAVADCEPEARIVTSWRWAHEPAGNGGTGDTAGTADTAPGRLTMTLEPVAGGTRLRLVHEGVTGNATGQAAGWYAHLAGLASHLAGTDPGEAGWDAEFARALAVLRDPGAAGAGTF